MAFVLNKRAATVVLCRANPVQGEPPLEHDMRPGLNEIDDSELAFFRSNPASEAMFKSGVLQVQKAIEEATPDETVLTEIAECDSVETLRRWLNTRGHRELYRKALVERYQTLTGVDDALQTIDADGEAQYV